MAEETEGKQEEGSAAASGGSGSRGKWIGLVILIVVVQVAATFGGLYLFRSSKAEVTKEELPSDAASKEEEETAEPEEQEELKEGEEIFGAIYPLEMFLVNLKDGGVIRIEMQLQFTGREVPRRLFSRMPIIRDTVISILSQKNKADVLEKKGREQLRADVKKLVNERLMGELVNVVLFTQYIVQ
jgi:flagellar FliL protein